MQEPNIGNHNNVNSILLGIGEIKANLAVNTAETKNIQKDIDEVKNDIKEIKKDFVSRREFNEGLAAVRDEISPLRKFVYWTIGGFGLAVLAAIANLVIK